MKLASAPRTTAQVALLLLILLGGTASAAIDLKDLVPLDGSVCLESARPAFDRQTGEFSATIILTNTSPQTVYGPVYLVIDSISEDTITVANADGLTTTGKVYIVALESGAMLWNEVISTRIVFSNPERLQFTFLVEAFGVKPGQQVLGPAGGLFPGSGGVSVTVPADTSREYVPISIQGISESDVGKGTPAGFTFLGAVSLNIGGVVLSMHADIAIPKPPAFPGSGDGLYVAQVVEYGGVPMFRMIDTAAIQGDYIVSQEPGFPGVQSSGTYCFLEAENVGWITGQITRDSDGTSVPGAVVMQSGGDFIDVTTDSGEYKLPASSGSPLVIASETFTGDQGQSPVALPADGTTVTADIQTETQTEYYEIWKSESNDPTTAQRIKQWHTGTSFEDTDVAQGHRYFYWVRSLICARASGVGAAYNQDLYLEMICPVRATEGFGSPIRVRQRMEWTGGNIRTGVYTFATRIREKDMLLDDAIDYWKWSVEAGTSTHESISSYDIRVGDYDLWGQAEIQCDMYNATWIHQLWWRAIWLYTEPIIEVSVNSTPDAGPTCVASQGTYSNKILLSWDPKPNVCSEITATPSSQGWTSSPPSGTVYFADAHLKVAVEQTLGVTDPTANDMLTLTTLDAVRRDISNLVGLEYATNLTSLNVQDNQISDLSPLSGVTNLSWLHLGGNHIRDLSPLSGLTNLWFLNLWKNQISDLSPLSRLTNLTVLNLLSNQIRNVSAMSALVNLNELGLDDNPITDLSPLSALTHLTCLQLSWTNMTSGQISALSGLTNLSVLTLNSNQISDLSALSGLTNLKYLDLYENQISDLSPLSGLTNLTRLLLQDNQIRDLSPLSPLTSLTWLTLQGNQINDLSPLSGLTNLSELWVNNNQISDLSPLTGLTHLSLLVLSGNPLTVAHSQIYFPLIRANNPGIWIVWD